MRTESRWARHLRLSLGSPQCIHTSFHLVQWKTRLHSNHCREIRPSFESGHYRIHSNWGSKLRVPLTYLLLKEGYPWGACGKLVYLFSRRQLIILNPRRYGVHRTFLKLLYWNWWSSILETGVSGNLWSFLKGVKPLILYVVDRRIVMEPMQGKLNSSQFDMWYTKLFYIPEVTPVFISSCDSVLGDSLEFSQANRGPLLVWFGKQNNSACNVGEACLISWREGSLMCFLEFWQQPVVYSPVMVGMSILYSSLFSVVRTPV